MKQTLSALALALLLISTACSEGEDSSATTAANTTMAEDMDMGDDGHMEEFAFGDPMDASTASRVIEITANDDFTFDPSGVTVTAGETVTFRVTNTGAIPHDFTLGDTEMQEEHEAEMAEMGAGMAHDEPNVFSLQPGDTKEMTWHLTEPGEIIFGCHQVGHYAAGMLGTLTVEG